MRGWSQNIEESKTESLVHRLTRYLKAELRGPLARSGRLLMASGKIREMVTGRSHRSTCPSVGERAQW